MNSQQQTNDVLDQANVGYFALTPEGLISGLNLMACAMLGNEKSKLLNLALQDFIVPEHRELYSKYFAELLQNQPYKPCELSLLHNDGSRFKIKLNAVTVKNSAHEVCQLLIFAQDIAQEQLQATERLQAIEHEQHLALIMDICGLGFWDWDLTQHTIIHSQQWYALLGLKSEDINDYPAFFITLVHEDDRTPVLNRLRAALSSPNGKFRSEHRLLTADHEYIWVLENALVVNRNAQGIALRMIGSCVNISDFKRFETQQQEIQQVYQCLQNQGTINQKIAQLAHDLNQPLSAAASYTDAAQRMLQSEDLKAEKLTFALEQTKQQIQRAGEITHQLFQYLRSNEKPSVSMEALMPDTYCQCKS